MNMPTTSKARFSPKLRERAVRLANMRVRHQTWGIAYCLTSYLNPLLFKLFLLPHSLGFFRLASSNITAFSEARASNALRPLNPRPSATH
jgi:hypothetical protein